MTSKHNQHNKDRLLIHIFDTPDNLSSNIQVEQLIEQAALVAMVRTKPDLQYTINFQFLSSFDIQQLNQQFRRKNKPTNVLSFPGSEPFDPEEPFIGDIAICDEIMRIEAQQSNKTIAEHLTHLIIHSVLHCQGFDHINDEQAQIMEQLEIQLLQNLNIANPYR